MLPDTYELIALGLRYWFVALGVMIVLSGWRHLLRERKDYRDTVRSLPDAGFIGEIVDLGTGEAYPLSEEGVMGSGRYCDIRIRDLQKRHLEFSYRTGKGILLTPCHRKTVVRIDGRRIVRRGIASHHSRITAGRRVFLVRFFAGMDGPTQAFLQASDGTALSGADPWGDFSYQALPPEVPQTPPDTWQVPDDAEAAYWADAPEAVLQWSITDRKELQFVDNSGQDQDTLDGANDEGYE